jgi:hypothetical protein
MNEKQNPKGEGVREAERDEAQPEVDAETLGDLEATDAKAAEVAGGWGDGGMNTV